jgi:uncharacterized membrane protein YfcA
MSAAGPTGSPRWLVLLGAPIGFASSLCGIGGGLFAGSLLHFGFGFDLRRATGTALVLVLATTVAATVTESLSGASAIPWSVVGALVVGVAVGAQLGFHFSERVPDRALRALFAVVLVASSLRILLGGDGGVVASLDAGAHSVPDLLWSALVGLGGGFAAPILGVGGGLVMVPGLYLGLEGLGFDAARAASLAAGCVGALRSLVLKARAGRVGWSHGLALGAGALLGAAAGVLAMDARAGLVETGRVLLALVLAFVGLRFAVEVARGSASAQA